MTASVFEIEAKSAPNGQAEITATAVLPTGDPMEYTIVGSVTGIVDEVGDIVMPGAFKRTLGKRIPKIIEAHDWARPIGKVLEIKELLPGSPELPKTTASGAPWPQEAGALVAKVRLFSNTQGKDAKVRWDEYGADQQFSIGYRTKRTTKDPQRKARLLHEVDLFEISDVLWGAAGPLGNLLSGPIPESLAVKMFAGLADFEVKGAPDHSGVIEMKDDGGSGVDVQETAPEAAGDDVPAGTEAPDSTEAEALPDASPGDAAEWDGVDEAELYRAAEPEIDWAEVDAAADGGDGDAEGETPAVEEQQPDAEAAPAAAGEPDAAVTEAPAAADGAPEAKSMPDWLADGMDFLSEETKTRLSAARALVEGSDGPLEGKAAGGADQNRGGAEKLRRYWTVGPGAAKIGWGTPGDFDRCVRELRPHMGERAKGYCSLRHTDVLGVPPGKGHGGKSADGEPLEEKLAAWSPDAEVGEHAAHLPPVEQKDMDVPDFPGSYEARRDAVREAANVALRGERVARGDGDEAPEGGSYEWDVVHVNGTFPDYAIVTRRRYGPDGDTESFSVPYTIGDSGTVELGEPVPVVVTARVTVADGQVTDTSVSELNPAADMVDDATYAVKGALASGDLEVKAGRALSGANETRLRSAVTNLIAVLAAAGVQIDFPSERQVEDAGKPSADSAAALPDTTSAGARETKSIVDRDEVRLSRSDVEFILTLGRSAI